jgi:Uma2 family endonuclease
MSTKTQLVTADELFAMPKDGFRYELVKGELRTISPAGEEHGAVIMFLAAPLAQYVKAHKLGHVFAAETGYKLASNPDTVLAPDIAFVRRERVEQTGLLKGYRECAPDLAVEVMSPGDTVREVTEKAGQWLAAGALMVWVVNPKRRTVTVYRAPGDVATLNEQDELDGGEVVPGFRCKVSEIFD